MSVAVVSFFSVTRLYRNQKPGRIPLTHICQVIVASFRKFKVQVPSDKSLLYEIGDEEFAVRGSCQRDHTKQLSFFDKASVVTPSDRMKGSESLLFTQLQRIAIGLVISIFAMLVAGTLELLRLREVRKHNYYNLKHMPMSIFWQVPQYFRIGCAEVFTFIGNWSFFMSKPLMQ
ncbi:NRT1/ PTR FAMILY 8.2 [Spatholobus suberectus]|nr:NRT1/ PTR FAMILY 8.2 [Spatholobus suberectus]